MRYVWVMLALVFLPAFASAEIGEVTKIEGTLSLTRGGDEVALAVGKSILQGDVIKAEADSNASIVFSDGSNLTIGEKTQLTIDRFVYNPSKKTGETLLNVSKGFFRFVSGQMKHGDRKVRTPLSTIGIRGTDLFGEIGEKGLTTIGIMDCCVEVGSEKGRVILDGENTFSKVMPGNLMPTVPKPCKAAWVKKSGDAMGISRNDSFYRFIDDDH